MAEPEESLVANLEDVSLQDSDRRELRESRSRSGSSGGTDTSSTSSDCGFAIKTKTRKWIGPPKGGKSEEKQFTGSHNNDVLAYLPIDWNRSVEFDFKDPDHDLKAQKDMKAVRERWSSVWSDKLSCPQKRLMNKICSAITIDIDESRTPTGYGFRGNLMHGAYPDLNLHETQSKKAWKDVHTSLEFLNELHQGVNVALINRPESPTENVLHHLPEWFIHDIICKAGAFVEAVSLYLARQRDIQEHGFTELFAAFASVVGLNFSVGKSIAARNMVVLGVKVTSETDLRALCGYMSHPVNMNREHRNMSVMAIAEVKAKPPDAERLAEDTEDTELERWYDSLQNMAGQLVGEMLLELQHGLITPPASACENMVAFAVQSTKVRVCLLSLATTTQQYIREGVHDPKLHDRPRGILDCSISLDMLKPKDRKRLWEIMMQLVNTHLWKAYKDI